MNDIRLEDVVQMRKKHPCGSDLWTVIRVGADIKIKCNGCGRIVMMDREVFSKRCKKLVKQGPHKQGTTVERLHEQSKMD